MLSVTLLYNDFVLPLPAFGAWLIVLFFTWLLHGELKKLLRNMLTPERLSVVLSHKLKLISASALIFAVAPIVASLLLHQPGLYVTLVTTCMFFTVIRDRKSVV